MTGRLEPLLPERMTADQLRVYRAITEGPRSERAPDPARVAPDGSLRGPFNALLHSPAVGDAVQALGAAVRFATSLSDRVREMAILRVAAHSGCPYERAAHEPLARRAGVTDVELARLAGGLPLPFADAAEDAALALVEALLDGDVTDEEYERLAAVLSAREMVDLSTLVGYYRLLAGQLQLFRVEP